MSGKIPESSLTTSPGVCLLRTTRITVSSPATVPATESMFFPSIIAEIIEAWPGWVLMTQMLPLNSHEITRPEVLRYS